MTKGFDMKVDIFYKGEFIATGDTTFSPYMLWTFIKPSAEVNVDYVRGRLATLKEDHALNYEIYDDASIMGFPPAFTVKKSEALV